jgi:hypothetical protein
MYRSAELVQTMGDAAGSLRGGESLGDEGPITLAAGERMRPGRTRKSSSRVTWDFITMYKKVRKTANCRVMLGCCAIAHIWPMF